MRKINSDELPDNCFVYPLIKYRARNRHLKNILAIQRTLEHCNKIRTDFESELDELKILNENKGYLTGLSLIFNELVHTLVSYEEKQKIRFSAYKDFLKSQIESAFIDPEMVDIIISYIQSYFKDDKKLLLYFLKNSKLYLMVIIHMMGWYMQTVLILRQKMTQILSCFHTLFCAKKFFLKQICILKI